jgi:hypothetical protein
MLDEQSADVAELVDALDLGSSFARSEGSSPFIRIAHTPYIPRILGSLLVVASLNGWI